MWPGIGPEPDGIAVAAALQADPRTAGVTVALAAAGAGAAGTGGTSGLLARSRARARRAGTPGTIDRRIGGKRPDGQPVDAIRGVEFDAIDAGNVGFETFDRRVAEGDAAPLRGVGDRPAVRRSGIRIPRREFDRLADGEKPWRTGMVHGVA
jgi:hypothetical protein